VQAAVADGSYLMEAPLIRSLSLSWWTLSPSAFTCYFSIIDESTNGRMIE
jgi:hypothetical protein